MNIDELVKAGIFAQIMRECFALLEKRHEGVSGMAYKQTVDLRAYLQTLYNTQPKSIKNPPVSIAALAGIAYTWLKAGEASPNAKLSEDDVREIRKFWAKGMQQKIIALMFGVSQAIISMIVHHKAWTHVA